VAGDGLDGEAEAAAGTNPFNTDTDGDGLSDFEELALGTDPVGAVDTDQDGLSDAMEVELGTNPLLADTDGDGLVDGRDAQPLVLNPEAVHYVHTDHLVGTAPADERARQRRARDRLRPLGRRAAQRADPRCPRLHPEPGARVHGPAARSQAGSRRRRESGMIFVVSHRLSARGDSPSVAILDGSTTRIGVGCTTSPTFSLWNYQIEFGENPLPATSA